VDGPTFGSVVKVDGPGRGGCLVYLLSGMALGLALGLAALLLTSSLPPAPEGLACQAEVRVGERVICFVLGQSPDLWPPVPPATPTPTATPTRTAPPTVTPTVIPLPTAGRSDLLGELRLSLLAVGVMLAAAIVVGAMLVRRLFLDRP
jgi:hypothetical protein